MRETTQHISMKDADDVKPSNTSKIKYIITCRLMDSKFDLSMSFSLPSLGKLLCNCMWNNNFQLF